MKFRLLFLCANNAVESPIAEALLNRLDAEHFEVTSAGIERGETHPFAIEVMKEIAVDLSGRTAKTIDDVLARDFDFVITLSARARNEGRRFPEAEHIHWQVDDPLETSDVEKQKRLFRSLRDQISQRIRLFALVQVRFAPVEPSTRHIVSAGANSFVI